MSTQLRGPAGAVFAPVFGTSKGRRGHKQGAPLNISNQNSRRTTWRLFGAAARVLVRETGWLALLVWLWVLVCWSGVLVRVLWVLFVCLGCCGDWQCLLTQRVLVSGLQVGCCCRCGSGCWSAVWRAQGDAAWVLVRVLL